MSTEKMFAGVTIQVGNHNCTAECCGYVKGKNHPMKHKKQNVLEKKSERKQCCSKHNLQIQNVKEKCTVPIYFQFCSRQEVALSQDRCLKF